MSYYNSTANINGSTVSGVTLYGSGAQSVVFNAAGSLSASTLSASYANTAGTTSLSSGTGVIVFDGRYSIRPPVLTPQFAADSQAAGISAVTVTDGGYFYGSVPTITFADPTSAGTVATGTAVLAGGSIASVTITNPGSGYVGTETTVTVTAPSDSIGYLLMPDRSSFKFQFRLGAKNTNATVTLSASRSDAQSKDFLRQRLLGLY